MIYYIRTEHNIKNKYNEYETVITKFKTSSMNRLFQEIEKFLEDENFSLNFSFSIFSDEPYWGIADDYIELPELTK